MVHNCNPHFTRLCPHFTGLCSHFISFLLVDCIFFINPFPEFAFNFWVILKQIYENYWKDITTYRLNPTYRWIRANPKLFSRIIFGRWSPDTRRVATITGICKIKFRFWLDFLRSGAGVVRRGGSHGFEKAVTVLKSEEEIVLWECLIEGEGV